MLISIFHIGKLFEKLKLLGLFNNSIIIITSDHGEAFGEKDLMNHGVSVYQNQVYIPLIIKYPDTKEGQLVNETVSVVDLMPTVLDILKYERPEGLPGKNLLKQDLGIPREVISESFPKKHLVAMNPRFNGIKRALFSWPYKYIESTVGKKELYDLSNDPNEKDNLYIANDNIASELAGRLNVWLKNTKVNC